MSHRRFHAVRSPQVNPCALRTHRQTASALYICQGTCSYEHVADITLADQVLWTSIARRYYLEGRSKVDISQEFGVSRFRVARILDACRESGLVTITISEPSDVDVVLSDQLRQRFGLEYALAIRAGDDETAALHAALGRAAAGLLVGTVKDGDVVGFTWGQTLDAIAPALDRIGQCDVVQMTGVPDMTANSVGLVKHIAAVSHGRAYPLYAPLVVAHASAAADLCSHPVVSAAMARWPSITTAVAGLGSAQPLESQFLELLSAPDRVRMVRAGVAAELCCTLLAADGTVMPNPIADRCLAVSAEGLRGIRQVIAVAGGRRKHRAVRAVLLSGLISAIVTDTASARYALEQG